MYVLTGDASPTLHLFMRKSMVTSQILSTLCNDPSAYFSMTLHGRLLVQAALFEPPCLPAIAARLRPPPSTISLHQSHGKADAASAAGAAGASRATGAGQTELGFVFVFAVRPRLE